MLVLFFVAQRRWWQAALAIVTTALLWLPAVGMGAAAVTFDPGSARTLPATVWLLVAGAAVIGAALFARQRSRYTALAASVAAVLSLPRLFVYEISLLLVGALDPAVVKGASAKAAAEESGEGGTR